MAWIKPRRLLSAPDARIAALDDASATLQIDGLFCGVCANRVAKSLQQLDAVTAAACDLERATATVQLSRSVEEQQLRQAVLDAAYAMPLRRAVERAATAVGL